MCVICVRMFGVGEFCTVCVCVWRHSRGEGGSICIFVCLHMCARARACVQACVCVSVCLCSSSTHTKKRSHCLTLFTHLTCFHRTHLCSVWIQIQVSLYAPGLLCYFVKYWEIDSSDISAFVVTFPRPIDSVAVIASSYIYES